MSLNQIAEDYVAFANQGKFAELLDTLYAEDAVSIESLAMPGESRVTEGLEAIKQKGASFEEVNQVHDANISAPWPHGDDKFAVRMTCEVTHIPSGHRRAMDEIIVLTVNDGKITKEEFFYAP